MSQVSLKSHKRLVQVFGPRKPVVMSSLASRLSKIQVEVPPELPNLDHYTMEELGKMTIDFGNTHKGRTYQHMWEMEQGWVLWFCQHYSKSTKLNHRLVLKYIEMQIELAETWNHQVPVYNTVDKLKSMAKPKAQPAKAKSQPTSSYKPDMMDPTEFDMLQEWELEQRLDGETMTTLQADVLTLQDRMANMEGLLQQVLAHLQPKAAEIPAAKP